MKLSVIIPTRSRGRYLLSSIGSALVAADNSDCPVEIVISDNASEDNTHEIVNSFSDKRIIYRKSLQRLSMRQNFEFALSNSSGSHVLFIGDDDAVAPHGLWLLKKILEETDADAVKWRVVNYIWPDPETGKPGNLNLRIQKVAASRSAIDPQKLLKRICSGRFRSYQEGVMIYHGCVSRRLIDRVRKHHGGPYFWCVCPDVYAAMQNIMMAKTPVQKIDLPITIGGESPASTGASAVRERYGLVKESSTTVRQFVCEYEDDPYQGKLGPDHPSMTLHMLDCLQTASKVLDVPLDIDKRQWQKKSVSEISSFSPEFQQKCKEPLNDLLAFESPLVIPHSNVPRKKIYREKKQPAHLDFKDLKIRIQPFKLIFSGGSETANSMSAAKLLDEILDIRRFCSSSGVSWTPFIWRFLEIHRRAIKYQHSR
ncbi:MAG: glycosyltransferase [Albidovulum sp.]|nr:glycosyltransferase [Albidovulum sp.]MDE0530973.1 glycosyltransferase [Albidovulum sp.]